MQMVALAQMVSVMTLAGTVVYFSMKMTELQKLLIMREVHFSDKLDSLKNSPYEALASKGSAGSKRFHSTIGGSSCRASPRYSVRHASRSSTRFTHRYM